MPRDEEARRSKILIRNRERGGRGNWYSCDRVQGKIWRILGKGMRGTSGRGQTINKRIQGTNFGPILPPPSTRPRAANWAQLGPLSISRYIRNIQPWILK